MPVLNRKWPEDEFLEKRRAVLARWPTGRDIDLDDAVAYHKRLPPTKTFPAKLSDSEKPLLRLSCGWATVEQTMAHMQVCEAAGVDLLHLEPDSYTRKCRYGEAQKSLEESLRTGKSKLNGIPLVNHGLAQCRLVTEATHLPVMFNGNNDEEPMLLAEMGLAAGCTGNAIHDLRDLIQHSKSYPLEQRILNNQYVCRLAGYYTERGAPIAMFPNGCLLNYTPPSIGVSLAVVESLTGAEQGVTHLVAHDQLQGNLVQDISVLRALKKLIPEYLERLGHTGIRLWLSCYCFSGAWPDNPSRATALLAWLTATACLGGADLVAGKSIQEAVGVTSSEASVKSAFIMKQVAHIARRQVLQLTPDLQEEEAHIEMEVRAILDRVLEMGDGDPLVGEVKAVAAGVLDAPFSAWTHIKGRLMPVRDARGALRYLDAGNLPFSREILDYHRRKIAERQAANPAKSGTEMLIEDISWLAGA